jgi:hypothetical protein
MPSWLLLTSYDDKIFLFPLTSNISWLLGLLEVRVRRIIVQLLICGFPIISVNAFSWRETRAICTGIGLTGDYRS